MRILLDACVPRGLRNSLSGHEVRTAPEMSWGAFARAVDRVAQAAYELLDSLVTTAPPRDREVEASKARARAADRFRPAAARHDT